jgi:ABC-2 type transport system ATP-binding protein
MQRRPGRWLIHDPEVILCDEPTVGVDPQSRNHLYEHQRLRDEGRTILYTTHYMEEAQRLCGRVAILDHGTVIALGTPDALIAAHGGVAAVTAELSAPPPPGLALPGVLDGSSLWFESAAPLQEVAKLVESACLRRASATGPRGVFLALTGRRLRD